MTPATQRVIAFMAIRMSSEELQGVSLREPSGSLAGFDVREITLSKIDFTDKDSGAYINESGSNGWFSSVRGSGIDDFDFQFKGGQFIGIIKETSEKFEGRVSGNEAVFSSPPGNYRLS